ncbi:MAG: hypothetical protein Q4E54_00370 [Lachnospiraceae bacterium]|nr:hypothetical protein [Lachnospiraceae bacterium]
MNSEIYVKKTKELLEEIRTKNKLDFEVLKVEYVNEDGMNYLRVYCDMDQEGGIGSDDCANIARPLSKALDIADFIEDDNYILEVCSPGFMNPAKTEPDEDIVNQEENDNE